MPEHGKSRIQMKNWYWAYAPDGTSKGTVHLNNDAVKRYEDKGWTFKRARYGESSQSGYST